MSTASEPGVAADLSGRSRLVNNVLTGWVAQAVMIITGFFLPRFISDNLGQVQLGIWDFAWSIVSYISLAQLGIGAALGRYVARYRSSADDHSLRVSICTTTTVQLVIAACVALVVTALFFLVPRWLSDQPGELIRTAQWIVLVLGMSVAVQQAFDTSRGVLAGCHRWDLINGIQSVTQVTSSSAMILAVYLGSGLRDLAVIYLCMATLQGIARLIVVRAVLPESVYRPSLSSLTFAREIIKFGAKSIAISVPGTIVTQGAYMATAYSLGPAMLAVLARPMALNNVIATFITRFSYVLTPMAEAIANQEDSGSLRRFILDSASYGMAMSLPAIIGLMVFGSDFISLWMGPEYVNQSVLWILCGGAFFSISQSPILRILIGLDRHGKAISGSMLIAAVASAGSLTVGYSLGLLSLEFFAIVIAGTQLLINGIYIPQFACRVLGVPRGEYARRLLHPRFFAIAGLGFLIEYAHRNWAQGWLDNFVLIGGFGLAVLVIYLFTLVPLQMRRELLRGRLPKASVQSVAEDIGG